MHPPPAAGTFEVASNFDKPSKTFKNLQKPSKILNCSGYSFVEQRTTQ
jgi:hypothetical protein